MKVLGIQRAERFSPNSVGKDLSILKAVLKPFKHAVIVSEDLLNTVSEEPFELIFTMGRLPQTMDWLMEKEQEGTLIINPAEAVKSCEKKHIEAVMKQEAIPFPPEEGSEGYWIKRGDGSAETRKDVVYCTNRMELAQQKELFKARGIREWVVQAHVKGDLVKFYGVATSDFFKIYYPGDDGISKFGDEEKNGKPQRYKFDASRLKSDVNKLAIKLDVPVYGGDAVITESGQYYIIDFNDWPSFSRCREEAAKAIVSYALKRKANYKVVE